MGVQNFCEEECIIDGSIIIEMEILFNILRCGLSGKQYEGSLTVRQFIELLKIAEKQAIFGLVFEAVKDIEIEGLADKMQVLEAVGLQEQIKQRNLLLNKRAERLTHIIASLNYKSCVLKGQGVAQLYSSPLYRQSGDIDIWVDGKQDEIVSCFRNNNICIHDIHYVHSIADFYNDLEVEVHFRPSWMYNPFNNRKLQKYFNKNKTEQFDNIVEKIGFAYPTIGFNLVYSLIHINRHIFEEGIGLRQLVDYYYILNHSSLDERNKAYQVLCDLSLKKFTAAIMFIEKDVLGIEDDYLLCPPDSKEGRFLLEDIMRGGNFGHYDERNKWIEPSHRFKRGFINARHNLRYFRHYPDEVIWIPVWKIWHWCWRKYKGYL